MKVAKDQLIAALRLRYDYYSAQTIFDLARTRADLADLADYDGKQVMVFREALAKVGDRLDNVNLRIDSLLGGDGAPAPAPAKAPEPVDDKSARIEKADKKHGKSDDDAGTDAKADKHDKHDKHDKSDKHAVAKDAKDTKDSKDTRDGKADKKSPKPATIALTGISDLADGEQVLVCGGGAMLGDWEPANACTMTREGDTWLASVDLEPGDEVTFKFLRKKRDGAIVWETGDDRNLAAGGRLDAKWR